MNPFEMVVAIIAITAVASVLRARYGVVRRHKGEDYVGRADARANPEAERLREEVKQLKERVAVLERLATDGTSALDREFEKLKQID
jgi:hypothetical protein